jgi:uncharacterized protein YdaU (DUF1376 family)
MTQRPKSPHYRSEHVHDAMVDADDLTNEELGAYCRLKWALWRAGGWLKNDGAFLARVMRLGKRHGRVRLSLSKKFIFTDDGQITTAEIVQQMVVAEGRRAKGLAMRASRSWSAPLNAANPLINQDVDTNSKAGNSNRNKNLGSLSQRQGAPDVWLYDQGVRWLMRVGAFKKASATQQVAKWVVAIGHEESRLAGMMREVMDQNVTGAVAIRLLNDQVDRIAKERKNGVALPFRPQVVKQA